MTADLDRIGRELEQDPALTERILREFPAAPSEPEKIIRCSRPSVDQAVARAVARAAVLGQFWRVEIVE